MNHTEAVRTEAVERYLLGQLSGAECEEFEVHFFDCKVCAEELRVGAIFEENAKAAFQAERAPRVAAERQSWWSMIWTRPWAWAPAAVALLVVILAGYQAIVVIPGLRGELRAALAPQAMASFALAPISRGDAQVREVPAQAQHYAIYMDATWDGSFAAYVCSVQDDSGATRFSVQLPAPPPGKPIEILLARTALPSGRYTVTVRNAAEAGKPEAELARYGLVLKLE